MTQPVLGTCGFMEDELEDEEDDVSNKNCRCPALDTAISNN